MVPVCTWLVSFCRAGMHCANCMPAQEERNGLELLDDEDKPDIVARAHSSLREVRCCNASSPASAGRRDSQRPATYAAGHPMRLGHADGGSAGSSCGSCAMGVCLLSRGSRLDALYQRGMAGARA